MDVWVYDERNTLNSISPHLSYDLVRGKM